MSYDKKYRERVLAHVDAGKKQEEVRKMFNLGANTITKWKKLRAETGGLENRELRRKHKKINPEKLREYFAAHPEAFDHEAAAEFGCTAQAIGKCRRKHKITIKKSV
jgi:transposase